MTSFVGAGACLWALIETSLPVALVIICALDIVTFRCYFWRVCTDPKYWFSVHLAAPFAFSEPVSRYATTIINILRKSPPWPIYHISFWLYRKVCMKVSQAYVSETSFVGARVCLWKEIRTSFPVIPVVFCVLEIVVVWCYLRRVCTDSAYWVAIN